MSYNVERNTTKTFTAMVSWYVYGKRNHPKQTSKTIRNIQARDIHEAQSVALEQSPPESVINCVWYDW